MEKKRNSWLKITVLMCAVALIASTVGLASPSYPVKGKPISIIVPNAPGGVNDVTARLIAPILEKELGTTVQVVNKPGGATQTGLTEAALAKNDGYTLVMTGVTGTITVYLDPDRQAIPQIKQLQRIALHNIDVGAVIVPKDSPFKTVKDLVNAAKANPGGLKAATDGLMGSDHMATLYFQKMTGTRLRLVHFDGGGPATTALAGGHVDLRIGKVGSAYAQLSAGIVRVIGVMDNERSKFVPEVPTLIEQGYPKYTWYNATGICAPKGTPRAIVDILAAAIKTSVERDDARKKLGEMALTGYYLGPDEFGAYWRDFEKIVKPLVKEAKSQK